MRTTGDRGRSAIALVIAAVVAAGMLAASPALGATEAQQGAQLLRSLQAGKGSCGSLATDDFDHIGEYVMERMLGSSAAHDAMNRQMQTMMGSSGETQAHVFMGRRFAGCATGRAPAAFGSMMGMMGAGMMGSVYGGGTSNMMGSANGGAGGMMGSGQTTAGSNRDDGWTTADTVMVAVMSLLVLLAISALAAWRPWRQPTGSTPLETLQARYARGDIDQQEFERRRDALGGTA